MPENRQHGRANGNTAVTGGRMLQIKLPQRPSRAEHGSFCSLVPSGAAPLGARFRRSCRQKLHPQCRSRNSYRGNCNSGANSAIPLHQTAIPGEILQFSRAKLQLQQQFRNSYRRKLQFQGRFRNSGDGTAMAPFVELRCSAIRCSALQLIVCGLQLIVFHLQLIVFDLQLIAVFARIPQFRIAALQ